jgi:type IV pilus assembly protein PilC
VVAAIVGLIVLVKLIGISGWGRYVVDRIKLGIPLFGTLSRKTAIARFSRTLGTLMTSGVPILQALNIVRDTAGNEVISRAVTQVHDAVKEGENMAPPIEASKVFPPMAVSMIEVGEETGEVPEMLMKIADSYDDDVDDTVAGLTSIIEPILIIFLAVIVGTIVIALFLPLISIIGKLS